MRGSAYLESFWIKAGISLRESSLGSLEPAALGGRSAHRRPPGGSSAALGLWSRFRRTWGARAHGGGERDRDGDGRERGRDGQHLQAAGLGLLRRSGVSSPFPGAPRAVPARCRGLPVEVPSPVRVSLPG